MKVDNNGYRFSQDDISLLQENGYVREKNNTWRQIISGQKERVLKCDVLNQLNNLKNGELSAKTVTNTQSKNISIIDERDNCIVGPSVEKGILRTGSKSIEHKHHHKHHRAKQKTDIVDKGMNVAADLAPKLFKQVLKHKENVANAQWVGLEITATILKYVSKIFDKIVYAFLSKQTQVREDICGEANIVDNSVNDESLNKFDSEDVEEICAEDDKRTVESEQELEDSSSVGEE